jgi:hypothetical protein
MPATRLNRPKSTPMAARRRWSGMFASALAASALTLLSGCATLMALPSQVSTYGDWPVGRTSGTYRFDRLPSQAASEAGKADLQARLEAAAAPALRQAGFTEAAPGSEPDVRVEIGAQLLRMELGPFADGLWWPGFGIGARRGWSGAGWSMGMGLHASAPRYEREVMVLIRDHASGRPLYEARAASEGATPGDAAVLRAMFEAALQRFPATDTGPRAVRVPLVR